MTEEHRSVIEKHDRFRSLVDEVNRYLARHHATEETIRPPGFHFAPIALICLSASPRDGWSDGASTRNR
jgi:hypothetical protein